MRVWSLFTSVEGVIWVAWTSWLISASVGIVNVDGVALGLDADDLGGHEVVVGPGGLEGLVGVVGDARVGSVWGGAVSGAATVGAHGVTELDPDLLVGTALAASLIVGVHQALDVEVSATSDLEGNIAAL